MIDVAPIGTRLDKCQLPLGVDADRSHPHEVDHDCVVGHSVGRMGAFSSHCDRDTFRPTVVNCCHDVPHTRGDDEAKWIRTRVEVAVPPAEACGGERFLVILCDQLSAEGGSEAG
jgi:hypothetical protein